MSPSRRQAALGLLAAGAATSLPPVALARAPNAGIETPDEDGPEIALATTDGHFEHMLAPVTINGQGPFNFVLDTGANISCVSSRLAQDLSLTPGPLKRVHTVVGVRERPSVLIDHLQVGDRQRRRVAAPSLPIADPSADGVLGVDWLKGQRLVLNFKTDRLEITRSRDDEPSIGRTVVIPARRKHGQLTIVDAELGGQKISAIIDSGAQTTLCNGPLRELVRNQERKRGLKIEEPRYVRLESLAGEVFRGEPLFLPFLRLGGLHLGNVQVVHADMHVFDVWGLKRWPALVIGMDLLKEFESVALDFGRSQVRFDFA